MQFTANARRRDCRDRIIVGRPNDVRIDCKAAKHSDGDRGTPPADLDTELRAACRPPSVDCSSAAIAARANKRRFVNLLQQLAGDSCYTAFSLQHLQFFVKRRHITQSDMEGEIYLKRSFSRQFENTENLRA